MTDRIPEEIMRVAERLYDSLGRGSLADTNAIARALMARDQRAAEIARSKFVHRVDMPGQLAFAAGSEIATDILSYDEASQ